MTKEYKWEFGYVENTEQRFPPSSIQVVRKEIN